MVKAETAADKTQHASKINCHSIFKASMDLPACYQLSQVSVDVTCEDLDCVCRHFLVAEHDIVVFIFLRVEKKKLNRKEKKFLGTEPVQKVVWLTHKLRRRNPQLVTFSRLGHRKNARKILISPMAGSQ